jgi:hypothetical protein
MRHTIKLIIKRQHDCTIGITWDTIEAGIEAFIDGKEGVSN